MPLCTLGSGPRRFRADTGGEEVRKMKVALVLEAAGAPQSLAGTAFAGALAEGLAASGFDTKVFGLTGSQESWVPGALGGCPSSAPWLAPIPPRLSDRLHAARTGVFDDRSCCGGCAERSSDDWYFEFLFDQELQDFAAGESQGVIMVYPRSYPILKMAARVAKRHRWKVLVFATEALTDNQIDPLTREDYVRCVARCADAVWSFSGYLADFWNAEGVSRDRIMVAPPVVRPSSLAPDMSTPERGTALYIGNLAHREVDYLLDIARLVKQQVPHFRLTVYGDATSDGVQALLRAIADRELTGVVSVKPSVSPAGVAAILRRADVLLLPRSHGEFSTAGFPNKLGEYLVSGRPAVVTDVGDVARYLTNGEDAYIVPPDDCEAFAARVVDVLRNPGAGDEVGAAGCLYAKSHLRSDVVARRLIAFLDALPVRGDQGRQSGVAPQRWRSFVRSWDVGESFKRCVVRVLRILRLKPPAPESEQR